MPPRGPRSVLCVVVVTKSECGTGLGCTPAATSPAMCAMSVTTGAPIGLADRADPLEVDHARVGARADHDHLRLVLVRQPLELVVVDPLVVLAHAVGDDLVELAGEVQRMAVRQVAAVRQVHAEDRVARLQQREIHRHVRLRARVRLHVGVLGAEQLLGPRDRQRLGDVDELAAAVVALARIPLGVLVGQHRAGRLQHGLADEVLRGDQLEAGVLPVLLVADGLGDLRVGRGERAPAGRGLVSACDMS